MKRKLYFIKKYSFACAGLVAVFSAFGQKNVSGIWQGMLTGTQFRLVFHITEDKNGLSASLDSPDQGVMNIKASTITLKGDSVTISFNRPTVTYQGKIANDSSIDGTWIQNNVNASLHLNRTAQAIVLNRPQTPRPPFPYKSQDVIYFNPDKSIQYGATITIPEGKGPFPAALLITGSGQQNRDEEIFGHKPFAVIADYLTRNGYIVLRVDDRSIGQTTGNFATSTSRDFANDAEISLDYLKQRPEVNANKIGLIGHSEGGMIAQVIAAERKDIAFIISLAGPGEKITGLMTHQDSAVLASAGMSKNYVAVYSELYGKLLPAIVAAGSKSDAADTARAVMDQWINRSPKEIVLATTGIHDDASKDKLINKFVDQLYTPWWRYFLTYDPAPNIKKSNAQVLVLNGDKDIQVIAATNLPAWEEALKKSRSKSYEIKKLPGLNHLFQHCMLCTVPEYGKLEETFAPEVLSLMVTWLNAHVK